MRGGEFMPELIGDRRLCFIALRHLVGIAADPVLDADLHRARREDLLEAPQYNLPCGEGVLPHERRALSVGHRQIGLL